MANRRDIVKRRKSVTNIHKITRTMEMIATAKFKKAMDQATGTKPYSEKIAELVSSLSAGGDDASHPLLQENIESNKTLLLVLTSNRGLCGGYNGNINRMLSSQIAEIRDEGKELELRVSGKKGISYCRFVGEEMAKSYTHFDDKTAYADVEIVADELIDLYTARKIDTVRVVYTNFETVSRHYAHVIDLLPLASLSDSASGANPSAETPGHNENYIFSPSAEQILDALIPTMVRMRLFQCFTDSIVSEQVARMTAMKAATDNAEQVIKSLGQQYNRARQSQITNELLDIMGGVEALK